MEKVAASLISADSRKRGWGDRQASQGAAFAAQRTVPDRAPRGDDDEDDFFDKADREASRAAASSRERPSQRTLLELTFASNLSRKERAAKVALPAEDAEAAKKVAKKQLKAAGWGATKKLERVQRACGGGAGF